MGWRHRVQFYESDTTLVDAVTRFASSGLGSGGAVVVLATERHLGGIAGRLQANGADPAGLCDTGRYLALDAAEVLPRIVVEGWPDPDRFREVIGGILGRVTPAEPRGGVHVFGELVALLAAEGRHAAAVRLEELWNDLGRTRPFSLFCAYPMSGFGRAADGRAFTDVCAEHHEVTPAESWAAARSPLAGGRIVAELQQRAAALEAEVLERRRLEAELQEKVNELAGADRRKDEFLATLAHELRNPLAPIRIAVRLVRSRVGGGDAGRYLDMIERQTENLTRLVDDLLDVSRVTQDRIELRREPIDIAVVVSRAVDATRHLLEVRRHTATVTLPERPLHVLVDPVRIEQVLVNLLANAAKYTPRGGEIRLSVAPADDAVEIHVRDSGIGIAPELLGRVFDLFHQDERARDRAEGGLGIGLTISRRLVELHGGKIDASSDGPGRGAEFTVRLPRVAPPEAERASSREREPGSRALRVLVVDDNVDAGEALAGILRDEGCEVRVAVDGSEALRLAEELRPQAILLDLGLPEMDGFEVARRIRAAGGGAELIALSGYGQPRDRRLTAEAGFREHLVKPVRIEALLRVLDEVEASRSPPPAASVQ
jgi:signal transduction histidine kinase/ActR/RegA family two-component response regulator